MYGLHSVLAIQTPGDPLNPDSKTGGSNAGAIAGGMIVVIIALATVGMGLAIFIFWFK